MDNMHMDMLSLNLGSDWNLILVITALLAGTTLALLSKWFYIIWHIATIKHSVTHSRIEHLEIGFLYLMALVIDVRWMLTHSGFEIGTVDFVNHMLNDLVNQGMIFKYTVMIVLNIMFFKHLQKNKEQ